MPLVVLLGGARSGKSNLAVRLAQARDAPVVLIATAEAGDPEMADRILKHRRERPGEWRTVEEPLELESALGAAPDDATVLIDCLTLWVANLVLSGKDPDAVKAYATAAAERSRRRPGLTIAVSNEVGMGIVPDNALARGYRDTLGTVNAIWATAADHAHLLVAGRLLPLTAADALLRELGTNS